MMNERDTAKKIIRDLMESGADKAQVRLIKTRKHELNVENGQISLLRTTFNTSLALSAIKDNRYGSLNLNKLDDASIEKAVTEVIAVAQSSEPDMAHDIAPYQPGEEFAAGPQEPDMNQMIKLLQEFVHESKELYPKARLEEVGLEFDWHDEYLVNSNDLDFRTTTGAYGFGAMFTAKDGQKTASFNGTGFSSRELEKNLMDYARIRTLLSEAADHLDAQPLQGKFVGDLLIAPDCLGDFIETLMSIALRDASLISGTSIFKDKLNQPVASEKFTLYSKPVSEDISNGYFVTGDGFKAQNSTIIEKGILKTFLLSLYGSNKTGMERAVNGGGAYVVEPGNRSFDEMVRSIDRGVLIGRFSGGAPSDSGDFSGVAKNSYYIENGQIKYPLNETFVSGNIAEAFMNIQDISKERISYGSAVLPWILSTGITISGK